jgi:hypothetical protein
MFGVLMELLASRRKWLALRSRDTPRMAGLAAFIEAELGIECSSNINLLSSDRDFAAQIG